MIRNNNDGETTRKSFLSDVLHFFAKGITSSTHKRPFNIFAPGLMSPPRLANPIFRTIRCGIGFGILGAVGAGTGLIAAGVISSAAVGALLGGAFGVTRHAIGVVGQAFEKDTYHRGIDTDHHYATASLIKPVGFALAWLVPLAGAYGTHKGFEALASDIFSGEKTTQIETTKGNLSDAFASKVAFTPVLDVQSRVHNFQGYTYYTTAVLQQLKL